MVVYSFAANMDYKRNSTELNKFQLVELGKKKGLAHTQKIKSSI